MGDAVKKVKPVLAQSFVNLGEPRQNRRWCIHRKMRIVSRSPVAGRDIERPKPYCRISFDASEGFARFQGHRALLSDQLLQVDFRIPVSLKFDNTWETRNKIPG